ncbi:YlaC family protein, partial [Enterobacter hormaechei]
ENIMHSPAVEAGQKEKLQKLVSTKGQLSFYDVFTLSRPAAA